MRIEETTDDSNIVYFREYFNERGQLHRIDGPAKQRLDEFGFDAWYENGELHREEAPAQIWAEGTKYWYTRGKLHRDDGAAVEYANGDKSFWLDGELIRIERRSKA